MTSIANTPVQTAWLAWMQARTQLRTVARSMRKGMQAGDYNQHQMARVAYMAALADLEYAADEEIERALEQAS